MNVKADANLTTIKRTRGYVALEYKTDGDLRSSRENEREFTVPSPMTATAVEPYAPTVLETFKPSESHGAPDFGFCNANSLPKRHNLRDLILLDNQSSATRGCSRISMFQIKM